MCIRDRSVVVLIVWSQCRVIVFVDTVCVKSAAISGVTNGPTVVLNCIADVNAYPSASYIWTNHITGSHSAGSLLVLQPGTQYKLTCTASNNFNKCNATVYVKFKSKLLLNTSLSLIKYHHYLYPNLSIFISLHFAVSVRILTSELSVLLPHLSFTSYLITATHYTLIYQVLR